MRKAQLDNNLNRIKTSRLPRILILTAMLGMTAILCLAALVPISLSPATSPTVGRNPQSIAAGDFNGDGRWDLAATNNTDNTVSILLGNGDGTFGPASNLAAGTSPFGVAAGDFNGDGKLDLAVANAAAVSLLLGNGDGTFNPGGSFTGGNRPISVAAVDLNKDGKLDLVVANFNGGTVSALLGNGNGTFGVAASFPAGAFPRCVIVADFNGDSKLDVALANSSGSTVSVLLGNGDGTFAAVRAFSSAGFFPMWIAAGDFNGDSKLDLAVANNLTGNVSILLGNGDGTFTFARNLVAGGGPFAVAASDFNGDNKLDLVVTNNTSNTLSALAGNGDGTFAAAVNFSVGSRPNAAALADLNGDGKADVPVANSASNSVSILLNNTVSQAPPNQAPVANAGPDQAVECAGPNGAQVTLNGSGTDPDGDALTYKWTDANGNVVGTSATAGLTLPLGVHLFTLTVDDAHGHTASDSTMVTVGDTTQPTMSLTLSPNRLWPPNHRLEEVQAIIQVSDTCDANSTVVLVAVVSNEADNGLGDGDLPFDIQGTSFGTDDRRFGLRAERSGRGSGRVYTVTYRARDGSGNMAMLSAEVHVPRTLNGEYQEERVVERTSRREAKAAAAGIKSKHKSQRKDY